MTNNHMKNSAMIQLYMIQMIQYVQYKFTEFVCILGRNLP